jgi:hypothetical protein
MQNVFLLNPELVGHFILPTGRNEAIKSTNHAP